MDKHQLRELIKETLTEIGLYSKEAENLLMGTAAQESRLGHYIQQLNSGPALGMFQMEPNTLKDIWKNFLPARKHITRMIMLACGYGSVFDPYMKINHIMPKPDTLRWNLKFAICMARVHYLRVKEPIPSTVEEQALYWKVHYNTHLGKGTVEEFIENYNKYAI